MSTECTYKIKMNSIYKDDKRKNYKEFTCFTLSVFIIYGLYLGLVVNLLF